MFLVVGLGNPEKTYFSTRHNIGFLAVDDLAKALGASWKMHKDLSAEVAEAFVEETKIILAKPQTFMNSSGIAAAKLLHRYAIAPQHVLSISDDVTLPFGMIRTRTQGSAGGHNGIASLITHVGTPQFLRVRIGVGINPVNIPLERWVLSKFSPEEQRALPNITNHTTEIILNILRGKVPQQATYASRYSPQS